MTNEEAEDIKQFFETTVNQSEQRLMKELGGRINRLREDMMAGFASIADIFDKRVLPNIDNHEERITKLERKTI